MGTPDRGHHNSHNTYKQSSSKYNNQHFDNYKEHSCKRHKDRRKSTNNLRLSDSQSMFGGKSKKTKIDNDNPNSNSNNQDLDQFEILSSSKSSQIQSIDEAEKYRDGKISNIPESKESRKRRHDSGLSMERTEDQNLTNKSSNNSNSKKKKKKDKDQ